jgi:hypothetical protein
MGGTSNRKDLSLVQNPVTLRTVCIAVIIEEWGFTIAAKL